MSPSPRRRVPATLLVCLALATLALLPVGLLQAQSGTPDRPIVAVRVEGNETIPAAVILQKISIKSGRVVSNHEVLDDIRSLYETKWFSRVKREFRETDAGIELVFLVKELPQVASVTYQGNDKKSDEQLSRVTGLEPGSPYRVMFNRDAAEQLRRYYIDEGFRHAKVTLVRGDAESDRDVVFQIEEGPKVRVAKVSFEGNKDFSDAVLKRGLETKTKLLGMVPLFGLFDPTTVPRDEAAITDYYRDLGYFDVKVAAEVAESEDRSEIYVTFNVEEGQRYRVRNVSLEGNEKLADAALMSDPSLRPGDFYNARFLQKDRAEMEKLYGEQGRLFTKILPVPEFLEEEPGVIDLTYQIQEDKVRYIRHINVEIVGDHPHTQRNLALNIVPFAPGDRADPAMIRKGQDRVRGSSVFGTDASVSVTPVDESENPVRQASDIRGQSPDAPPSAAGPSDAGPSASLAPATYRRVLPPTGGSGVMQARPAPLSELPVRAASYHGNAPGDAVRNADRDPLTRAARRPASPENDPSDWVAANLFHPPVPLGETLLPPAWVPTIPTFDGPSESPIAQITPSVKSPEENGFITPTYRAQSPDSPSAGGGWEPGPVVQPVTPGPVVTAEGEYNPFRTIQQTGGEYGPGVSSPLLPQSPNGGPFQGTFNEPPPFQEPPGFVDIDVRAREERTGRFMVGAAVNSSSGLVGQVTLQEDNFDIWNFPRSFQELRNGTAFRGRGQRLRIEAVPGAEVSRYLISLTDPYFLDSLYSVGVSGFYYSRYYDEWDEQRLGGRLTVGRQLTPFWSIVGSSRLEDVKIFNPTFPTPPKLAESVGDNTLFTVGASLKYDSRNRAILPSEGTFAEFGYTQGLGDFVYPRFDAEAAQYWLLNERPDGTGQHVLSLNGAVGLAGDDMPIFENYYLGGFQTLRGFDFRGVSPLQNGVRVGGRFSTYGSLQYRFPILVNDALQGVVFSDFGTVNDSVSLDDFRASVGAGIRVSLPQAFGPAPLAFDFAVPVAGPDFDDEQLFSFNIGMTR
ncbi:POTRA domain-containing protein [Alienimonas californiensis]|uniref:Outer membrane protein assembly factor BamA n=1 Tax=Alienimonas californiensis TaxID=2527989 RepID=A0A517PD49_9PLAN|nr:BamA/TamA family outer membrane protein [Alienimonas californiensis]QDT17304.1 Outer membrane protein assembly factor BamA precursor [Alienimonas californiensis]